jgi:ssDNA-binding Zn-finger/Zn-ribbon topoisomerase 1
MSKDLFDEDKRGAAPDSDSGAAPTVNRQYFCPRCRGAMRRIDGKMGPFWGCSNYPACDKRLYDKDGRPSDTPDERYRCPVCTRPLVHAKGKPDKDDYWYCTGYNKGCKVTLADDSGKPAQAWRCPLCGHQLKQRRGKKGLFWGCSQYPLCTASFADLQGRPRLPP